MEGERTVSRRRILRSGAAIGGGIGTLSLLAGTAGAQPEEYVVTQIYRPNGLSTDLEGAECTVSSNDSTSRRWCRFYTDQYVPVTIDVSGGGGIDDTAVRSRAVRFWGDERVISSRSGVAIVSSSLRIGATAVVVSGPIPILGRFT